MHANTHTHARARTYARTHTHPHAHAPCMLANTHTHTHTHTLDEHRLFVKPCQTLCALGNRVKLTGPHTTHVKHSTTRQVARLSYSLQLLLILTGRPGGARGHPGGGALRGGGPGNAVAVRPEVRAAVVGGLVAEDVAVTLGPQYRHGAVVVPAVAAVLPRGPLGAPRSFKVRAPLQEEGQGR